MHTEHILVFLPDCFEYIYLCVVAFAHCAFMCLHDYMNDAGGGGVTTFSCGMYVELISAFHRCSIIIIASEYMTWSTSFSEKALGSTDSPGDVTFPQEPEVLKTQPEGRDKATISWVKLCLFFCFVS